MDRKTRDIFLNNGVKAGVPQKCILMRKLVKILRQGREIGFEDEMGRLYTGEIRCRICDPLTLVYPGAEMDEEIRWIVERKPRDIDYIKERYGKDVSAEKCCGSFDVRKMDSTRQVKTTEHGNGR